MPHAEGRSSKILSLREANYSLSRASWQFANSFSDVCGLIIESKLPMPQLPTLNFQSLTVRLLSVDYLNQDRNQIHRLKSPETREKADVGDWGV